jgi:hypothetical protein
MLCVLKLLWTIYVLHIIGFIQCTKCFMKSLSLYESALVLLTLKVLFL